MHAGYKSKLKYELVEDPYGFDSTIFKCSRVLNQGISFEIIFCIQHAYGCSLKTKAFF